MAERNIAIVIGDFDLESTSFRERSIELYKVTIEDAPKYLNLAKAIIVVDFPGKFGLIKQCYSRIFPEGKDHGLAQVVLVHSIEDFSQVAAIRKEDENGSSSQIFELRRLWAAAEHIARHRSGPSAGTVRIEPQNINLDEDETLLLRRAFHDCERIYLEPIRGGKASMSVFRVHAWMKQSEVGPLPLPFFAKIAQPREVDIEKEHYRVYAEHYIPFNLRPNIDRSRCVETRSKAALIGNFVDDAVPLREALRSGHGTGSLFSLFETTLKGFRLQPFASGQKPVPGQLEGFVTGRIKLDDLRKKTDVIARATELGFTSSVQELYDTISSAARTRSCIIGPCHGDLHTGNVMIRGGDAILIDFGSTSHGPLTADPATLEASLMFGTEPWEKEGCFLEWRAFVDEIYGSDLTTLHPPALFETKPGGFSWLRRSLRELRHVLLTCEGSGAEAKLVLATYLMRYARLDIETLKKDNAKTLAFDRHCYALVVAERIVKCFSGDGAETGERP